MIAPPQIGPSGGVRVLMATKPVDFRKGANGLAALIKDEMKADPFSGVVYVFRARRADRIKLLYWDGTGVGLMAKTLEQGGFRWPKVQEGGHAADRRPAHRVVGRAGLGAGLQPTPDTHAGCGELTHGARGGASKP